MRTARLGLVVGLLGLAALLAWRARDDVPSADTTEARSAETQGPESPPPLARDGRATRPPDGATTGAATAGDPGEPWRRAGVRPPGLAIVDAASGEAISRVRVVRRRKVPDDPTDDADRLALGDDGRLPWSDVDPRGRWIAVGGAGWQVVVLDGDAVDLEVDREVRLEPATAIDVTVTEADGRTPVPFAAVEVAAVPAATAARDAPPAALLEPMLTGLTEMGEDGHGTLVVGVPGPVRVAVSLSSWHVISEPAYVELPRAEGTVRFRLVPACKLAVRVTDAATRRPLTVPFGVTITGSTLADPIRGSTTNPEGTGVFDLFPHLRPDVYEVTVQADGYAESVPQRTELREPGDGATVEVALRSASVPALATLRLRLPLSGSGRPTWLVSPPTATPWPKLLARAAGAAPGAAPGAWGGADVTADGTWDALTRVWTLPRVPPGRYDLFVFDAVRGAVGAALGVEAVAARASELTIDLRPGVQVVLRPVGSGATFRKVRVEALDGTRGPLVTQTSLDTLQWDDVLASVTTTRAFVPVPGDRAWLRWKDADGALRERLLP